MDEKMTYFEKYNRTTHLLGRIITALTLTFLLGAPFLMGAVLGVMPDMDAFANVVLKVGIVWAATSVVEYLVYTPMLGAGGSYLAFITGNLINMKIPCAINARDMVQAKTGTPENEIIATLSIATASLVTLLVLAAGVMLLIPLQPVLESPVLRPAFDNVVPALFGAMAYKYYRKSIRITVLPLTVMTVLFILVPSLISSTSFMILPSGLIAIIVAYLLYRKNRL